MSGGHWQYLQYQLEEYGAYVDAGMQLLGAIEHELDWGICGDGCYECAKIRTVAMLEAYYDNMRGEGDKTWKQVRDDRAGLCDSCKTREEKQR